MTPILYSPSEQDFTTLGLGALNDAISCEVHTVLNGVFELEMQYPVSGRRYSDLKISCIIKAVAEKNGSEQLFDIYAITRPISGVVTVYASHISGRKQFIPIMPCMATDVVAAFQTIKSHSAEENPFTFWTDKSTVGNFILKTPASLGNVLGGMEGSILDTYKGEYEFDNFTIRLWNRRGLDNGVTLRYGKNITSIEQEESIASTVTGICPFWADMDGNTITLSENVIESEKAANFPFKRTVVMDFSSAFDEEPTEAQLRSYTQSYIASNNIGVPNVGIDLSYENLSDYEEYKDVALLEQVRLGDTVRVYFEPLDITAEARVTETYYDTILEKYKRVRVGTVKASLSAVINDDAQTAKANTETTKSVLAIAFEQAIDLLSGADGGNIVIRRNEVTDKPYEILIMDTDDMSTARNVLRLNMNGLGLSTNGINGPYTAAITGAGIVATAIKTGILTAIEINNGNGTFRVTPSGELTASSGLIAGWNINATAIYKDVTIGSDTYRVYFQPPNTASGKNTWVLSCQKKASGASSFSGIFHLDANGAASFGNGLLTIDDSGQVYSRNSDSSRKAYLNGGRLSLQSLNGETYIIGPYLDMEYNQVQKASLGATDYGGQFALYNTTQTESIRLSVFDRSVSTGAELVFINNSKTRVKLNQNGLFFYDASGTLTKGYLAT